MRWLNRRRRPARPEVHARHSDRHPSRPSGFFPFFQDFGKLYRGSIPATRRVVVAAYPVFLQGFVNYFTFQADGRDAFRTLLPAITTIRSPRIPSRTVRRVHVSPWASTVRLITRIRSGHSGGDDDGSAGGRYRR